MHGAATLDEQPTLPTRVVLIVLERGHGLGHDDARPARIPLHLDVNRLELPEPGRDVAEVHGLVIAILQLHHAIVARHDIAKLDGILQTLLDTLALGAAEAVAVARNSCNDTIL